MFQRSNVPNIETGRQKRTIKGRPFFDDRRGSRSLFQKVALRLPFHIKIKAKTANTGSADAGDRAPNPLQLERTLLHAEASFDDDGQL